uniref:Reverse transcriptase Ty1/copia-type domain-containing protein n=2 Tax=Physcomitrium patens TaxID=3218 RepID=A0A7I4BBN6_PHYPA
LSHVGSWYVITFTDDFSSEFCQNFGITRQLIIARKHLQHVFQQRVCIAPLVDFVDDVQLHIAPSNPLWIAAMQMKWSTVKLIVALATSFGWFLSYMDIVTAFLNGTLKETIYMLQPPGFSSPGKEDLVCRLKKSIYGLKQSPRTCSLDPNLYLLQEDGKTIILLLVDDHLITRNYEELIADLKQQLKSKYEMKYLGPVKRYLGVDFHSLQSGIFLHQKLYADQIVLDYDMQDCCSVSTPLPKELE